MANSIPKYSVQVRDQYGRLIATIARPMQKQFTLYRNKPGSFSFVMSLFDSQATPQILQANLYDIVVLRYGTPLFSGKITFVEPSFDNPDKQELNVTATGYMNLFSYRVITEDFPGYDALHSNLPYADTDVGQIAWSLINYSQFPTIEDGQVLIDGVTTYQQSFVAQGEANVKTLQLLLQNQSASGNFVISLQTDNNGFPSGLTVPNSTMTIPASNIQTSLGWFVIDYSGVSCHLADGDVYWINVSMDSAQAAGTGINWAFLNGGYYPAGNAYSFQQPNFFTSDQDLQFFVLQADNSYQMTKNTYFGIQQGTIQTSFQLAPTFTQFKKIKDALTDLTSTFNGVDMSFSIVIDPVTNFMTKYFNIWYPRIGSNNTSLNFQYPGNIKKMKKAHDGTAMENEVIVRGNGSGIDQLVVTVRDNPTIQAYGLYQNVEQESDLDTEDIITSLGNEYLRTQKTPIDLPNITMDGSKPPSLGTYNIGDTITIQSTGPAFLQFTSTYRIEQMNVKVDDDDMEEAELMLSLA